MWKLYYAPSKCSIAPHIALQKTKLAAYFDHVASRASVRAAVETEGPW